MKKIPQLVDKIKRTLNPAFGRVCASRIYTWASEREDEKEIE
jgi:hypothetical protein